MVSYRLITFLFILSHAGVVSSKSTAIDNQEQVPCSNDENTSAAITTFTPPSPTTKGPTTTGHPCQFFEGASPYKRKNGWWCTQMFLVDVTTPSPLSWDVGTNLCKINGYPSVSSLETDEEKRDYSTSMSHYFLN
ncbi:CBN-CLEC-219 protein [Caenorhabditis brenneri]|uniref:CBN-CLEC-219 protein n=1 Tax=Caenorhabditis brenneri TaxID=135651 RepID=G0NHK3_CAEBE|nr:CBN-CLEC-219 protein [Caenorhabditis brenneri]